MSDKRPGWFGTSSPDYVDDEWVDPPTFWAPTPRARGWEVVADVLSILGLVGEVALVLIGFWSILLGDWARAAALLALAAWARIAARD